MKKVEIMKTYFGTPERPVTVAELTAFIKADKDGYDECVRGAAKEMGVEVD